MDNGIKLQVKVKTPLGEKFLEEAKHCGLSTNQLLKVMILMYFDEEPPPKVPLWKWVEGR